MACQHLFAGASAFEFESQASFWIFFKIVKRQRLL
jgi:hypothetical protein